MEKIFNIGDHVTIGLLEGPVMIVTSVDVQDGKNNSRCGWYDSSTKWNEEWFASELLARV
jgi:uncharacterized protein YodC (DUF2158 family)